MKDETKLVMIIDRSGSMSSVKSDAEGGLKQFIEDQQKEGDNATLSVYQFDDKYDVVYEDKPIMESTIPELNPRGMTALYDAIGKTINSVGEQLKEKEESERPNKVIFCIITDGKENNSKEFSGNKIKEMINHQRDKYNWSFIFVCSDEEQLNQSRDIFGDDFTMKMGKSGASNRMAYANLSTYTTRARKSSDVSSEKLSDDEKQAVKDD